ncbi:terminase small subunit [Leuconostoc gasicomitatum]|uniref:terminase small subunit n=1 Tax=Leuconostoc gasicomitatum TaxID=115778 RepID=UPI001CC4D94E|nr:terminase small subunit [Leuconostoc gasicomitatum]MBZ5968860.1 terminase small subunit [Leuconostoc gasicomitatum]
MKKYEEAEQDYLSGLKYKDISDKYDVSEGTVRQWKRRHWSKENVTKKDIVTKNVTKQKPTEKAIEELSESDLTDKRKAFVLEFLRTSNATQSYINVYDVDYQSAKTLGHRLLTKVDIQEEIKRLRAAKLQELSVGAFDLIEDLAKEARADIREYIRFGEYDVLLTDSEGDVRLDTNENPIVRHESWVQIKSQNELDTWALKKISKGKDGLVVELHDRNKARDRLLEMMGDYAREDVTEDGLINAIKSTNVFGENDGIET